MNPTRPHMETLRGRALYDALMQLRPDNLSEYEWAAKAGVNRGFFNDLKMKDTRPRTDTLAKVLNVIGARGEDLPGGGLSVAPPPAPNARVFQMEGASAERMYEDIPVYGTALGADEIVDGTAIEQTTLNRAEVVTYFKRPVVLNGRSDAYGLYVVGSSMSPRFEEGEVLFVERRRAPRIGDDVVVYLRPQHDGDDGASADAVLVKRLVRRTAGYIELQQFNPAIDFQLPTERVLRIDRVIPWAELVS